MKTKNPKLLRITKFFMRILSSDHHKYNINTKFFYRKKKSSDINSGSLGKLQYFQGVIFQATTVKNPAKEKRHTLVHMLLNTMLSYLYYRVFF